MSRASLRNLYDAYPSLEMYTPFKGQRSCSHGYLIEDPLGSSHGAAREWSSKHRQHTLRNNLEKGRFVERDVDNFGERRVITIAADGNFVTSLSDISQYRLHMDCMRLRPHTFCSGGDDLPADRTIANENELDYPGQLEFSNDARWTVMSCALDLEKTICHIERPLDLSTFSVHGHGHNGIAEKPRNSSKAKSQWLWLIDSDYEPARSFKLCVTAAKEALASQFTFSADSAYLMILHRDYKLREIHGAGCIVSLQTDPIVSFSLPSEIQNLVQPRLLEYSKNNQHFVVYSGGDEQTYVIFDLPGERHCIELQIADLSTLFCKTDAESRMSAFSFDHAFHVFEHHKDRPTSLLRVFNRSDELFSGDLYGSTVLNVDMSSMPQSIMFMVIDETFGSIIWLEQSTTAQSSRIIAESVPIYCTGTRMKGFFAKSPVRQNLAARMPYITAEKIESSSDGSKAKLLAWNKEGSDWRSIELGIIELLDYSLLEDIADPEEDNLYCEISMSICGMALTWICDSTIFVSEQQSNSTSESGGTKHCCTEVPYPAHFGRPIAALFTRIDESLFVVFTESKAKTCMQSDKFRPIIRDPLKKASRLTRSDCTSQTHIALVNYHKSNHGWEVRWLTVLAVTADIELYDIDIHTSADGSLMIFNFGDEPMYFVLDFAS